MTGTRPDTAVSPGPAAEPVTDRRAVARAWTGALMISFSGVWVRLADVEAVRSSFLRTAYALPAFLLLVLLSRRRRGRPLTGGLVGGAVVAGSFLGADLAAWHGSIGHIGAGLGTVLPNLQVVMVGVAGVVLFGERPRRTFWLALPVVLVGVTLLSAVGEPVDTGGNVVLGVLLGVLTAALYSVFLVGLRRTRLRVPDVPTVEIMASATVGAALVTFLLALSEGVAGPVGAWPEDGYLVLLALGSQVTGWMLLSSSIHKLPAALTSVALLLQPVLAVVWGAVFLGEEFGLPQLAGAAAVLLGVAIAHRAITTAPGMGRGARART